MRIRASAFLLVALSMPVHGSIPNAMAQTADTAFTDSARQRFQEGVRLFDQGKFEEARAAFLQAYALKQHPAVLLNLAQSELHSDHPVEAARHFSEFLRDNPNVEAEERAAAEQGLAAARTKTARLDIKANLDGVDVFVDGTLIGRTPLFDDVDVAPGSRTVELRAGGKPPQSKTVDAPIGQVRTVMFSFDLSATPPVGAPETESSEPPESTKQEGRMPFFDWLISDQVAWASGGATVLGLGTGILFAIFSHSASNDADSIAGQIKLVASRDDELGDRQKNPCADPVPITSRTNYGPACRQLKDNLDIRDRDKTVATIGFVVAGVGAISTGVLYYLRTEPEDSAASTSSAVRSTTIL
ncbi:MAG TPA: hypothetical protein PLV85_25515, partial [Polyangiaceae bacterium]|nr:hypothetical protein [Polyangiaceae bacterium]